MKNKKRKKSHKYWTRAKHLAIVQMVVAIGLVIVGFTSMIHARADRETLKGFRFVPVAGLYD